MAMLDQSDNTGLAGAEIGNYMKIATWNVNSLTVRLPQVLDWLTANPDVGILGLQELKLVDEKFPHAAFEALGYRAVCLGQKTYNGVALISRQPLEQVQRNIPGHGDEQARVIAATLPTESGPLRLVNCYFVNGQAPGTEKFAYKLDWLQALHDWLAQELRQYPRLVLMGDFNVAPQDCDTYDPVGLAGTIHHTEEERAHFRACWRWACTMRSGCSSSPRKAFPGGTTACWVFRKTGACGSTISWSARRCAPVSAPAISTAPHARTNSPATIRRWC